MQTVQTSASVNAAAPLARRSFWSVLPKLVRNDVKLIGRDSFLSGMVAYIIFSSLLLRFAALPLAANLMENQAFDLTAYFPLLVSYIAIQMGAILGGTIFGFLLLEERDDQTLKAMLVSPVPLRQYLAYRIGTPMVLGFIFIITTTLLMNLALIPLWQLVIIAAAGSTAAAATALFFATFAGNKIEGFAILKVVGTLAVIVLAAWFIPEPFQYLAGIFPPYWVAKAYWLAYAGSAWWWLPLLIGVPYTLAVTLYFARRFERVVYQ